MTEVKEVYRCKVCGNVVEVLRGGKGILVCCNEPMILEQEHREDPGLEKHVPVIEEDTNFVTVKIGEIEHPMEDTHYIEWIELIVDGTIYRKYLNVTDKPEASFPIPERHIEVSARAYCNIHGLWKS
jgi:superoxide reductase